MTSPPVPPGLVVVDKPGGLTSHAVVARVRRLAGTRKVGHAGTLDPMATGVLLVGVGRATRLLGHLMLTEKAYDATVRLGATTTTDDADGDVVETRPVDGITEAAVRAAVERFVGDIEQVPTAVSAVKVDGKRAYQRVREGEQVELAARPVTVHELVVHEVSGPPGAATPPDGPGRLDQPEGLDRPAGIDVRISVRCSSGTYVRAIARDLGEALGVGGHLTALRRTAVGPFDLAEAHTLDELADDWSVLPLAEVARRCFPSLDLTDDQAGDVRVGRALDVALDDLTAVFDPAGEFLALYEPRGDRARARAVFTG